MSDGEIVLTEDGSRALREAENFCWRHHVAIVAAEHVLAGALVVVREQGVGRLPTRENIEGAVVACIGAGSEPLTDNVMFGSAARTVISETARRLGEAGGTEITAAVLARGALESGEVGPMFYSALGTSRNDLLAALQQQPA